MASISYEKQTKRRAIQFVLDGKRFSIRLGKVNKKQAESAKFYIEDLLACKMTGTAPQGQTAEWVASLASTIRKRLERAGLVPKRPDCPRLGKWLAEYIGSRSDVKPNTIRNLKQVERNLIEFFGNSRKLDEIAAGDADEFRIYLKSQELSEGTIRRRCKRAKQFFYAAIKKKLISENPFNGLNCGNYSDASRFYFVTSQEAQAVLDGCPDAEWRLIFALCRYGGLRCPSEVLGLKWEDIDWERSRFTVRSSKTEHHVGGGIRQVPIFPELHPHLRDCFEQAEEGQVYVISQYRDPRVNLRTRFGRIIERTGLESWPKLFQNLRSTRETELAEQYPIHVICAWIGNSPAVAAKHYLQVTEGHFKKAVQNPVHFPVQQAAARLCTASHEKLENDVNLVGCETMRNGASPCKYNNLQQIPPRGLEPLLPG